MAKNTEPVSRLKQYYVLRTFEEKGIGKWKEGEIVEIDPSVAIPYIGARIIIPLASAIRTHIIPPIDPISARKAEELAANVGQFEAVIEPSPDSNFKRKTIKNTLKDAVQLKKSETTSEKSKSKEPESLESTNKDVIITPSNEPKELSDQEKAIQEKIAALKKKNSK